MTRTACFALLLAACGGARAADPPTTHAAAPAPGRAPSAAVHAIRAVDFKNFTYRDTDCGDAVTVKAGSFARESDPDDRVTFDVNDVVFGDVTGDGIDDAVVTTNCNTGGTGQFSAVAVFVLEAGRPRRLATVAGGDRADGGISSVRIEGGALIIDQFAEADSGGACCPGYIDTTRYHWNGQLFAPVGQPSRAPVDDGAPHS